MSSHDSRITNHPLKRALNASSVPSSSEEGNGLNQLLDEFLADGKYMEKIEIKREAGVASGQARQYAYVQCGQTEPRERDVITIDNNVESIQSGGHDSDEAAAHIDSDEMTFGIDDERSLIEDDDNDNSHACLPNRSLDDEDAPPCILHELISKGELTMPDDHDYLISANVSNKHTRPVKPSQPVAQTKIEAHTAQRARLISVPHFDKIYLGSTGSDPSQLGNKVVSGTSTPVNNFAADPRTCSTIVRGNCKEDSPMAPGQLRDIHNLYTVSAMGEKSRISCFCLTQNTPAMARHTIPTLFDDCSPILLIIGDAYVPPVLGGDGRCAVIIRLHNPTPANILTAVKSFFVNGARLPQDSIVLISLNTFLIETNSHLYIKEMEKLIDKLGRFFLSIWSCSKRVTPEMYDSWAFYIRVRFLFIAAPHALVDAEKAIDFASVNHFSEAYAALACMRDAGPISSHYERFMLSLGDLANPLQQPAAIPSASLDILPPGQANHNSCFTEKSSRPAFRGIINLPPGVLTVYWSEVALKLVSWYEQLNISVTNLPGLTNIWAGLAGDPVRNLRLDAALPEAFMAIKQFAIDCGIELKQNNLIDPSPNPPCNTSTAATLTDKPVNAPIALIGNSNANNLRLDLSSMGIEARHYGFPAKHITQGAVDAINRYRFSSNTLVILDGFCNATLEPESSEDDNDEDRLPLTRKESSFVPRISSSRGQGKLFHQVIDLPGSGNSRRLVPIDDDDVDGAVELLAHMAEQIHNKSGAQVLILGPMPRYPTICCNDPAHHIAAGEVSRFIRDLNYFLSLHKRLNTGGVRVIPFHVAVRTLGVEPYAGSDIVSADNVHLQPRVRSTIAKVILDIKNCKWDSLGFPNRTFHECPFKPWREALHKKNVEAALHSTDCQGPLADRVTSSKRTRDGSVNSGHPRKRHHPPSRGQPCLQPPGRDGVYGRLGPHLRGRGRPHHHQVGHRGYGRGHRGGHFQGHSRHSGNMY